MHEELKFFFPVAAAPEAIGPVKWNEKDGGNTAFALRGGGVGTSSSVRMGFAGSNPAQGKGFSF